MPFSARERPRTVERLNYVELGWALAIIVAVSAFYFALVNAVGAEPRSSGPVGHGLGIVGFVLMLMTETLYSLRKRSRLARWGRTANWLRFHIVTGLVGPYLVLLHAAWRYQGLAGLVMLMTVVVVISGFTGRYIYTRVPRNADGLMLEASELRAQAEAVRLALATGGTTDAKELRRLTARQTQLERQAASIGAVRRAMGVWTSIHIPLGVALFTAAFVHVVAALYFATFLR
jgi:hypothetical protein